MAIRPAVEKDYDAIWRILEPMIRCGETYPLPRDMNKDQAFAFWFSVEKEAFVWEENGKVLGRFRATGIRPRFYERLKASGIQLPASLFQTVVEIGQG